MKTLYIMSSAFVPRLCLGMLLPTLVALSGCNSLPKAGTQAQAQSPRPERDSTTPVDVAIARTGTIQETPTFIGTTRPAGEVSLRSRVEGRLLSLNVNIGDRVARGQIVGQLDDALLLTAVTQAQAELAALESEVARAQTQVSNARVKAQQARVELKQAQNDARRRQFLGQQGAISKQEAELAQTAAQTSEQTLLAAIEQISTEQKAVAAAQGRVAAQRAAVAQTRERLSYARVVSPISGIVIERVSEAGNLLQPGGEILKLGDFSRVKVVVPVSELELSRVRVGQSVQVQLDAFPNQSFSGTVTRISPAADATARQVPVEIQIPNNNGQIGSGLLARVSFSEQSRPRVIVPQTALEAAGGRRGRGAGEPGSRGAGEQVSRGAGEQVSRGAGEPGNRGSSGRIPTADSRLSTIFVVTGEGNEAKVAARQVQVGDRANGKVEILSGLQAGERYVVRSGKQGGEALKDGEKVRLSVLSERVESPQSQIPAQENNAKPQRQQ